MRTFTRQAFLLFLMLWLAGPILSQASGTYGARPPRPPAKKETIDHEKYGLGKKVFAKGPMAKEANATATATQAARLTDLEARIPKSKQSQALPAMAGKLTQTEMDALEYYLKVRYKLQ